MDRNLRNMRWLVAAVIALTLAACASMGRPEGGPRDTEPPRYVKSSPAPGAVNYNRPKVDIYFNENVKIDDAMNRVVVSPAQRTPASVIANGRKVTVELRDSLRESTTYTIDFSDAIRDLNEGNILDGFAMDFSTGPTRDSLQISGMVFEARNLEPAQGMMVGVYSNLADSAITTLQLERIAKTNQLGQFTIRNLKPGTYRIFAINDINRDYHWDRSEDVAFYDATITPEAERVLVNDTLVADDGSDSIVAVEATRFGPNDIVLSWFNEEYKALYLKDHSRPAQDKLFLQMAAESDSLPMLTIVNGSHAGRTDRQWAVVEPSAHLDSLTYWITDPAVAKQDTLLISTRYRRTDALDQISWATDTIKYIFKRPKPKKDNKKKEQADTAKIDFLKISLVGPNSRDLNKSVAIEVSEPLASLDTLAIRLETLNDTVWQTVPGRFKFSPDSTSIRRFNIDYQWTSGARYRVKVDSLAMTGVHGHFNAPFTTDLTMKTTEDYANLFFKVDTHGYPVVVELLNSSDKPVAQEPVVDGTAEFTFVNPGTYYARAFIDANNNGKWDNGRLLDKIQPEEVYYYPQKVNVRRNWDIEQNWDIFALPLDLQKPLDIKKNKPKLNENDGKSNKTSDADDEDEFYDPYVGSPGSQYNSSYRNSSSSGGRRNGNIHKNTGMGGGFAR